MTLESWSREYYIHASLEQLNERLEQLFRAQAMYKMGVITEHHPRWISVAIANTEFQLERRRKSLTHR